jgi:glyoxalase family protein
MVVTDGRVSRTQAEACATIFCCAAKTASRSAKLEKVLLGLHHVTAFAGDAQTNLDFYRRFLGLRLIKRTVNFDDPATYHFYFGNANGTPGKILTFFPWPTAPAGRSGAGQSPGVSFAVPRNSLDAWMSRARDAVIPVSGPHIRFGEAFIQFADPHGLSLELFASSPDSDDPSVTRLHSATLCEAHTERTFRALETLGFEYVSGEGNRSRFDLAGTPLDVIAMPDVEPGRMSAGMVHHIAWRVANEAEQLEWRAKLTEAGFRVTRVIDRQYFRSIYFREPGGVLFEIATDGPGVFIDEAELGQSLKLPPWLEPIRDSIERRLPPLSEPVIIGENHVD